MKNRGAWLLVALAVVVATAVAVPRLQRWLTAPPPGYCPICMRHAHKESAVRFQVQGEAATDACCMSCALTYGRQTHKPITILSVTDYQGGSPLEPGKATFVVGSDVSPCAHPAVERGPEKEAYPVNWDRCLPSILAFRTPEAADAFRDQHGGHVRTLDELLRVPVANEPVG